MKRMKYFLTALFGILAISVGGASLTAHAAYDPYGGVNCKNAKNAQSTVCSTTRPDEDPLSGDDGLLIKIADIVSYIAGAAAVIIILVGSFRYVTSGGDSNKISSAKNTILGALIGIVIVIMARTIIYFVVNKL